MTMESKALWLPAEKESSHGTPDINNQSFNAVLVSPSAAWVFRRIFDWKGSVPTAEAKKAWPHFEPPDRLSALVLLQVFVRARRNWSSYCVRRECSLHGETRRIYCIFGPAKQDYSASYVLRRTSAPCAVMNWSISTASLRFSSKVDKISSMAWSQKIGAPKGVAESWVTWRKPMNWEFVILPEREITSLFSALRDKPKVAPLLLMGATSAATVWSGPPRVKSSR